MDLINAIATYFDCPNSAVRNIRVDGADCWFSLYGSTEYTCTIVRGKFLKKNSIRLSVA